jgi:hypothetical protein
MLRLYTLLSLFFIISCKQEIIETSCDQEVFINNDAYNNNSSANFTINSVEIEDNCLIINFGASGCDGSSWQEKLIDSEEILESIPVQRNLIFSLENSEICLAYFTKEVSFDISSLQISSESSMVLNIENGINNFNALYEY